MESIVLSKKYLDTLLCFTGTYSDIYYDKSEVYKIFSNELNEELINELKYLNYLNLKEITNPLDLIIINNQIKGFSMKYFNGFRFDFYTEKYSKKIELLKKAKEQIQNIHRNNIIIGDLHDGNILYNEKQVIFCDPDGLLFNKKVKRQNIWEKEYYDYFKEVDKRCDIYLFNILTLALIQKRSWSTIKHMDIGFKNNELSKILSFINDFKESNYDCSYMIDYLPENEKEFKKLTKSF